MREINSVNQGRMSFDAEVFAKDEGKVNDKCEMAFKNVIFYLAKKIFLFCFWGAPINYQPATYLG